MALHKDFTAALAANAGERPTFTIAGQTFTLRAKLPYKKWNALIDVMRSTETSEWDSSKTFFNTALIAADRDRFLALMDSEDEDDDLVIGMVEMSELTDWAMEHFTGKLRSSTSGSTPGAAGTGQPANVVSLSPRTTTS